MGNIKKNKEKDFRVEQVASVIEVCYLTEPNDVYEFCTFLMGEDINPGNVKENSKELNRLIKEQYPTMKRTLFLQDGDCISERRINEIVTKYRKTYGEIIKIKSKSLEEIKTYKKIKREEK